MTEDAKNALCQQMLETLTPIGWMTGADEIGRYARDWLGRELEQPWGIARPSTTAEVSDVIKICAAYDVCVVPQGGNTGLVCGALSPVDKHSIILSTDRMTASLDIDEVAMTATVSAGVILGHLHDELATRNLMLPLHLGAEGSAQIGGLIATNAGGSHAFRYGTMVDHVLGLEVVLPDGSIWDGLRQTIKDNAGYQLRKLFCGAEGTLGVVTKAIVKLHPAPKNTVTALVVLPDLQSAVSFGAIARAEIGEVLSALEFFSDEGLSLLLKNVDQIRFPVETRAGAYVLIEARTSLALDLSETIQRLLERGFEKGLLLDGVVAASETQRSELWAVREEMPEGQRLEGRQLKHDIAVPVSRVAEFVSDATESCNTILKGLRVNAFGHLADGNIHFNLSPPENQDDFNGQEQALNRRIYSLCERYGGSFAAEHGLGRLKATMADELRPGNERLMMRGIKSVFDPKERMNPGAVVNL